MSKWHLDRKSHANLCVACIMLCLFDPSDENWIHKFLLYLNTKCCLIYWRCWCWRYFSVVPKSTTKRGTYTQLVKTFSTWFVVLMLLLLPLPLWLGCLKTFSNSNCIGLRPLAWQEMFILYGGRMGVMAVGCASRFFCVCRDDCMCACVHVSLASIHSDHQRVLFNASNHFTRCRWHFWGKIIF